MNADLTKQIEELFELGAHFGHRKSRVHPKSYQYIYKVLNGVSIIDLTQTVTQLQKAKQTIVEAAQDGKTMMVVTTKKNVAPTAAELCSKHAIPYTTTKWLPGLLTNFDTIIENVKKMEQMADEQKNGGWDDHVKHERIKLAKELTRLERFYKGLSGMRQRPDIIFIVDIKKEKNALKEAKMYSIPTVAIVDTNANPNEVDYPILMNDDAPEVVEYVLKDIIESYAKAYTQPKAKQVSPGSDTPKEPASQTEEKPVKAKPASKPRKSPTAKQTQQESATTETVATKTKPKTAEPDPVSKDTRTTQKSE